MSAGLSGVEGPLVSVRVRCEPRLLEDLLECLATVPFPINPQIYHGLPTTVEFPAYETRLYQVRDALRACGFGSSCLHVSPMLEAIGATA